MTRRRPRKIPLLGWRRAREALLHQGCQLVRYAGGTAHLVRYRQSGDRTYLQTLGCLRKDSLAMLDRELRSTK